MVSMKSSKQELMDEITKLNNRIYELESVEKRTYPPLSASKKEPESRGGETILVVDDTEEVRGFAVTLLRNNGYNVLQAPDGETALKVYRSHAGPVHLILSDIVMPDLSGLEVVRKLRPLRQETQVLFMSGYNTEQVIHDDVFRIMALGANYIPKPLSSKHLLRKIRSLLD